jgi:hypothetical protein
LGCAYDGSFASKESAARVDRYVPEDASGRDSFPGVSSSGGSLIGAEQDFLETVLDALFQNPPEQFLFMNDTGRESFLMQKEEGFEPVH